MIDFNDSFSELKEIFRQQTGLDWKQHLETYIEFVKAISLTAIADSITHIKITLKDMNNEVEPDENIPGVKSWKQFIKEKNERSRMEGD